jgi:hypothetical protein
MLLPAKLRSAGSIDGGRAIKQLAQLMERGLLIAERQQLIHQQLIELSKTSADFVKICEGLLIDLGKASLPGVDAYTSLRIYIDEAKASDQLMMEQISNKLKEILFKMK